MLPFFAGETVPLEIADHLPPGDFQGKSGDLLLLPAGRGGARRIALIGLGDSKSFTLETLRAAIAILAPMIQKYRVRRVAVGLLKNLPRRSGIEVLAQTIVETLLLANYRFALYKTLPPEEQPVDFEEINLVLPANSEHSAALRGAKNGTLIAEAINEARNLGNHPSNVATPAHLAKHALNIARHTRKIKVKILGREEIKKENMDALLAVAQGSDEEPKFIVMEYLPRKKGAPIVLVGKGITFDSGGISIKPAEKMEEMKFDMAGAATVLAIMQAASELALPVNLIGLIGATENLPSGKSMKPGDIVKSAAGPTVEIVNTDAEGRLVLADALHYAKRYKPTLVIDFATLTGSIVVALGDDIIGGFTNSEKNFQKLQRAAAQTGEKLWQMPLDKDYEPLLKSDYADLRNQGLLKYGDAINAANFLKNFVDYPWIHLDIAGVAWATREKPYRPKGATGTGVRLTVEFLKNLKK